MQIRIRTHDEARQDRGTITVPVPDRSTVTVEIEPDGHEPLVHPMRDERYQLIVKESNHRGAELAEANVRIGELEDELGKAGEMTRAYEQLGRELEKRTAQRDSFQLRMEEADERATSNRKWAERAERHFEEASQRASEERHKRRKAEEGLKTLASDIVKIVAVVTAPEVCKALGRDFVSADSEELQQAIRMIRRIVAPGAETEPPAAPEHVWVEDPK